MPPPSLTPSPPPFPSLSSPPFLQQTRLMASLMGGRRGADRELSCGAANFTQLSPFPTPTLRDPRLSASLPETIRDSLLLFYLPADVCEHRPSDLQTERKGREGGSSLWIDQRQRQDTRYYLESRILITVVAPNFLPPVSPPVLIPSY